MLTMLIRVNRLVVRSDFEPFFVSESAAAPGAAEVNTLPLILDR
jgi:hypothetical protein